MSHSSLLEIDKITGRPNLWNIMQIAYFGFPQHFFPDLGTTLNTKVTLYLPLTVYNVISVKQVSLKFDMQNNLFGKTFFWEKKSGKWSNNFLE